MLSAVAVAGPGTSTTNVPTLENGLTSGGQSTYSQATGTAGTTNNITAAPTTVITTPGNSTPTATIAAQTANQIGQEELIQGAIALSLNVENPGFATPLPAVVAIFGSQGAPTDTVALPSSIGPIQPSQFTAPPPAPLGGGDVAVAVPNANPAPAPSQNPSESMLNDDMIARADSAHAMLSSTDALTGAASGDTATDDGKAADEVFQSLADEPAIDVVDQHFAASVDKLAADDALPVFDNAAEHDLVGFSTTRGVGRAFQNPVDESTAPEWDPGFSTPRPAPDWRAAATEWAPLGAVAAWAGAGGWPKQDSREEQRRGRRVKLEQRPRW